MSIGQIKPRPIVINMALKQETSIVGSCDNSRFDMFHSNNTA